MLTSGFIDLQVNGYGGVDFNQDDLTAEQLHAACLRLREGGTDTILATIITEHLEKMAARIARIVELRQHDPLAAKLIGGIHVEGPFINPADGYRGAHPADAVRSANVDDMKRLLDAGAGLVRIVTLAPERDPGLATTRMLARQGIVVAAGHCDSTLDELLAAIDAGLSMFTHLGNGCPMRMHRHDNIIQRALSLADRLRISFIADGAHVPFFALRNYLRAAGIDRCIIVSDAVAPAGLGPGRYNLGRWDLHIGEDLVARAPDRSHLIGSAITMRQAAHNLSTSLGLSDSDVDVLCRLNPRRLLGEDSANAPERQGAN